MAMNDLFVAGARLEYHGQFLISHGRGPNGKVKLANKKMRTTQYLSPEKLDDEINRGRCRLLPPDETVIEFQQLGLVPPAVVPLPADLSSMSKEDQEAAHRRLAYVKAARAKLCGRYGPKGLEDVITEVANAIGDPKKPGWRSVVRWLDRFTALAIRGLVFEKRGNSHSRLDDIVEQFIERAFEEHYLKTNRPALKSTHLHLEGLIEVENEERPSALQLFAPSYHTLKRRLADMDRFEVLCARFGIEYAHKWFRTYSKSPRATKPMEVILVDHTPLDVEVTFRGVFRLGKPTLTIARDQFTGAIVGLHLTFGPPSYASVMECLQMVISPKNLQADTLSKCKHGWNMSGLFEIVRVDNGAEFKGLDLQNAAGHLEFDIEWCPPRKPWFKAQVERTFGVLRTQLISRLRARTFTVREDQPEDSTEFEPLLDIDELREVLIVWAVTIHNERPYVATGLPPRLAWEQGCRDTPPRNDKSETEIKVYLGACIRRALHPYGIEFKGLTFNSPELTLLRQQLHRHPNFISREDDPDAGKLLVKYSPHDLGSIFVLDPLSNTYIEAKCTMFEYATGLTLHRHRLNLAHARHLARGTVDAKALIAASRQLDQMIADLSVTQADRLGGALARAMPRTRPLLELDDDDDPAEPLDGASQTTAMVGTAASPPTTNVVAARLPNSAAAQKRVQVPPQLMELPITSAASPSLIDHEIDDLAASWTRKENN